MALRTTFRPEAAGKSKVTYMLRLGPIEVHARVRDGAVTVGRGPVAKPDLVIETGPAMKALLAREITPAAALKKRLVRITGDPKLTRSLRSNVPHLTRRTLAAIGLYCACTAALPNGRCAAARRVSAGCHAIRRRRRKMGSC